MISKIDHINISVADLEICKKFFIETLGFMLQKEGDLSSKWIDQVVGLSGVSARYAQLALPNTETNLELIQYFAPKAPSSPKTEAHYLGFRHMAFTVTGIEDWYEKLKTSGVEVFSEIQVYNKTKKLFYFRGPEGIILELCEHA